MVDYMTDAVANKEKQRGEQFMAMSNVEAVHTNIFLGMFNGKKDPMI